MARLGFIRDKLDIKFLLLFITSRLIEPADFARLTELTLIDDGVDYFLFAEAVTELTASGHLEQMEDGRYLVTAKGIKNGRVCESSLPFSVRKRVEASVAEVNANSRRSQLVKSEVLPRDRNGFTVRMSLDDPFENILRLELLAVGEEQAKNVERNFQRHPERIYNAVLGALLADYDRKEGGEAP